MCMILAIFQISQEGSFIVAGGSSQIVGQEILNDLGLNVLVLVLGSAALKWQIATEV